MSAMKLQKLAYYAQAWHLVWEDEPLFEEDFQAWSNGSVCPELYALHIGMYTINSISKGEPSVLKQSEIESVDAVLEAYGKRSAFELSNMSHAESPWINARGECPDGERSSSIIEKEAMRQFFSHRVA
jgi:uncharacterized phage-associated protein